MTSRAIILISLFAITMAYPIQSQEHTKHSVLAIEYIGESDKPVTPIVISDSRAGAAWYRKGVLKRHESDLTYVHVVNASLLKKLIADVETLKGAVQQKGEKNSAPSMTVSVAVITPESRDTFLYDPDSALPLLESLQKSCDKKESLCSDLAHFRDRIRALR
jgi:hypothetical protein